MNKIGTYPGGKGGAGTYQAIINQQPPHAVYIEPFLGHGGVLRRKRPAAKNIGVDLDAAVIARWGDVRSGIPALELHCCDALAALADWRLVQFQAMTRRGPATECLWMNYPDPASLHTTWYVGADFRERERIKRKRQRWARRIAAMDPAERQVILEALLEVGADIPTPSLTMLANTTNHGGTVPGEGESWR